ncbi:MAG: DegT/DnrJ/EryC1/StrS family aminotransferase [Deltaproteobacteria bacterium]|nr:DegT/DnrJ/EryC1/StrS family aminotransferase [Deltaproteobacteria bacterium]
MPFSPPLADAAELSQIESVLKSGWLTRGPKCDDFEAKMASYLGAAESLAVSSCTAALHLALKVLDLGPKQGVIVTPLTFPSTVHAIVYLGATPFLVDIEPKTGNLDPELVRLFLTKECHKGPNGQPIHTKTQIPVKALLPIHYGGFPADLGAFWSLCQEYNLALVEDAAHALGARYDGRLIGDPSLRPADAPPNLVAFSFYATKNLATGEGGLLMGSPSDLIKRARVLSAYGINDARRIYGRDNLRGTWDYDVVDLGFKYNFTDIGAAIGLAQLEKLPRFLAQRQERAAIWTAALESLRDLVELPAESPNTVSAWHLYPLKLHLDRLTLDRDSLSRRLNDLNLGHSVMFRPIHLHTYYQKTLAYPKGSLPRAEDFFARELSLPIAPALDLLDLTAAANLLVLLLKSSARV